jgi:hypothetical protein
MVFQRFSYVSKDVNNETRRRQQFKSTQSGSQGTCFVGGGGTKQQVWSTVKSTSGKQQLPPQGALTVHMPNVQFRLPT